MCSRSCRRARGVIFTTTPWRCCGSCRARSCGCGCSTRNSTAACRRCSGSSTPISTRPTLGRRSMRPAWPSGRWRISARSSAFTRRCRSRPAAWACWPETMPSRPATLALASWASACFTARAIFNRRSMPRTGRQNITASSTRRISRSSRCWTTTASRWFARWKSPPSRCRFALGWPTSAAVLCICSTPICRRTSRTSATSRSAFTAAITRRASCRKSCSASAACGCCGGLV